MAKPDPGPDFWRLIEPRIGPIDTVEHTVRGYPSDVTAIVRGGAGSVFVKAARDPGPHVSSLQREAAINPYVRSVSPALRWQHHGDGWIALGFDVVDGRHADFTDPADLAMVADLVGTVGKIDCPDIARDWAESRWDRYTE